MTHPIENNLESSSSKPSDKMTYEKLLYVWQLLEENACSDEEWAMVMSELDHVVARIMGWD
jgi:hypothetical protein